MASVGFPNLEVFMQIWSSGSMPSHTSYLSFLLHGQDFWVNFCSTQKYVNRDKMDFAPKQRKSSRDSIHCKFVTWSKVWYREQFVVDPHNKITPHDK